jgi:hypothetical protein
MRKITKRSAAIIAASAVAVGGAGAAWAAWSLNTEKSATVTTGEVAALEVSTPTVVSPLVPGVKSDVTFTVKNHNNFPVQISNVSYGSISTNKSGCPSNNLQQVADAAQPTAGTLLQPAGVSGDTQVITFVKSLRLKPNPDDACQAAQFDFKVVLAAASAEQP